MKFSYKTWLYSQEVILSNSLISSAYFENSEKICINGSINDKYMINEWVDVNKFKSYYKNIIYDKLLNISKNNKEEIYNLSKKYICKTYIYIDITIGKYSKVIIQPFLVFSFLTLKDKINICFNGETAIKIMNNNNIIHDDTYFTKDLSSLRDIKVNFLKSDLENIISILDDFS